MAGPSNLDVAISPCNVRGVFGTLNACCFHYKFARLITLVHGLDSLTGGRARLLAENHHRRGRIDVARGILSGCSISIPGDGVLLRLYLLTPKGTFPDGPPYAEWQILI